MKRLYAVLFAFLLMPTVQAAKYEPPAEGSKNPAPAEALRGFQHFDHRAVVLAPGLEQRGDILSARDHLQENINIRSVERMKLWNERSGSTTGRTLVIEPIIEHARFVSPGKRAFIGVLWGSSHLDLRLRLTDAATGQVIGEPHFYQHAGAGAAGWAFGAVDRAMLIRITNMVDAYLRDNYEQTVETSVDVAPDDTPAQTAEKQELQRRATGSTGG